MTTDSGEVVAEMNGWSTRLSALIVGPPMTPGNTATTGEEELQRCGTHNYSLFLAGDGVSFGYVERPGALAAAVAAAQEAPYFATGDLPADQQMRPLEAVFHLL